MNLESEFRHVARVHAARFAANNLENIVKWITTKSDEWHSRNPKQPMLAYAHALPDAVGRVSLFFIADFVPAMRWDQEAKWLSLLVAGLRGSFPYDFPEMLLLADITCREIVETTYQDGVIRGYEQSKSKRREWVLKLTVDAGRDPLAQTLNGYPGEPQQ